MTGCIKESDFLAVMLDLVRTNMLGNTSGFTFGNRTAPDNIQKRGFAMIDMTEYCNNRRTPLQTRFFFAFDLLAPVGALFTGFFPPFFFFDFALWTGFIPHFRHNDSSRIVINLLVNGCHNAVADEFLHHFNRTGFHQIRQFTNG